MEEKNVALKTCRLWVERDREAAEGGLIQTATKPPPSEPSEPSYNMFGRGRLEDLSLLDLSPLQHEHAFGIMVIGAIEDIPLNPV